MPLQPEGVRPVQVNKIHWYFTFFIRLNISVGDRPSDAPSGDVGSVATV